MDGKSINLLKKWREDLEGVLLGGDISVDDLSKRLGDLRNEIAFYEGITERGLVVANTLDAQVEALANGIDLNKLTVVYTEIREKLSTVYSMLGSLQMTVKKSQTSEEVTDGRSDEELQS